MQNIEIKYTKKRTDRTEDGRSQSAIFKQTDNVQDLEVTLNIKGHPDDVENFLDEIKVDNTGDRVDLSFANPQKKLDEFDGDEEESEEEVDEEKSEENN